MTYAQARDSEYPPYLLDFTGTPGERHAENIKVNIFVLSPALKRLRILDSSRSWNIEVCQGCRNSVRPRW